MIVDVILSAIDLKRAVQRKAPRLGRVRAVAIGKGAIAMVQGLAEVSDIEDGIAVSPVEGPVPKSVKLYVADHPTPSHRSFKAGEAVLDYVSSLSRGERVVFLVSGGASSLAEVPLIPEDDFLITWDLLLRSGLDIHQMNAIRKRISAIKGGKLGAMAVAKGAYVYNLIASDVPCDDPSDVGSGPAVPDSSTAEEALTSLKIAGLWERMPITARTAIEEALRGKDTPKEFRHEALVIAKNLDVLTEIQRVTGGRIVTSCLVGEARELGRYAAYLARETGTPLLLGGEPTVTVRGGGRGGRTTEFALSFILASRRYAVFAMATDGLDGNTGVAGVWADPGLLGELVKRGDVSSYFAENNTLEPFAETGRVVRTGPTGSNLNIVFYIDEWSRMKPLLEPRS